MNLVLVWHRATHNGALYPAVYFDNNLPPPRSDSARLIVSRIPVLEGHTGLSVKDLVALPRYAPPPPAEGERAP